ncbi:MAG: membrane protein YdbS with pleckstrin-like domain [Lysobacterales bacterium]|jgi:membrane protein YdbS with pleckstrin-like domain
MSSIHRKTQQSQQGRAVLITMSVYWAITSLIGTWLWFEKVSPGLSMGNIKIILPLMLMIGLGLIFLLRQTSLKLSDLFFATLR